MLVMLHKRYRVHKGQIGICSAVRGQQPPPPPTLHIQPTAPPHSGCQGPSADPVSDQYLEPFVIVDDDDKPVGTVEDGDAVVLFNFRADRMVEISKAFEYPDFDVFDR